MALVAEVLGWSGTFVALAAYLSLSLGKLTNGSLFQMAQLFASVSVMTSSYYYGAWPSVALNAVWALIAAVALVRFGQRRSSPKPSQETRQAEVGHVDEPEHEVDVFSCEASGPR